jgi:hypothetical protein
MTLSVVAEGTALREPVGGHECPGDWFAMRKPAGSREIEAAPSCLSFHVISECWDVSWSELSLGSRRSP